MGTPVNTTKVSGRRVLQFHSLDDIAADVEALARAKDLRALGNWTPGQIVQHLAVVMNKSIDGFTERPPAVIRFFLSLLLKRRMLTRPMSPGFNLPARAATELVAAPIGFDAALPNFRQALARLKVEAHREPHPAFGALTREQWEQLHCRHSELHLSFVAPAVS